MLKSKSTWASTLLALLLFSSLQTHAAPSRAFIQELGRVSTSGHVYVDLYNNTGKWTPKGDSQIRIGTPYGEAILAEESLGGKFSVSKELALYAMGYFNTGPGNSTDLSAGAAYQIREPSLYLNLNPFVRTNGGNVDLHFATAVFTSIRGLPGWMGETQLGAEFQTPTTSAFNTGVAIGVRWLPRDYMTFDLIFAGDGGEESTAVRTPAALRFNLRF